jgi:hypothetical protein
MNERLAGMPDKQFLFSGLPSKMAEKYFQAQTGLPTTATSNHIS